MFSLPVAGRYLLRSAMPRREPTLAETVRPPGGKPIVVNGTLVDIEIQGMIGFTDEQKKFYIQSMQLKAEVFSSLEFKNAFLNLNAAERRGMSLSEIYERLILGNDSYSKQNDRDVDTLIHLYKTGRSSTIGYHNSCCLDTYLASQFYNNWMRDPAGKALMAGHSAHEYFHVMGFIHRFIKRRSLVYQTGYLVRDLGKKVISGGKLTPLHRPPA